MMIFKNSWRLGGAALALFVLITAPATAAGLDEADPALKFIPAEASIYQSMLRNREKLDIVLASRAWKTLMELPVVRMGWGFYQTKVENIPESGPAQFHAAMQDPQVQDLLKVLADMVSDEIFVYSDQSLVDFLELAQEVNGAVRYGPAIGQLSGQAEGLDPEELQARLLMATLAENTESLRVPNLIFGFKVSDPQRVIMQLAKLELIAGFAVGQLPGLKGSLKRTQVGPGEYLVLTLDGKMIPWEEVPVDEMKQLESRPGDLEKIISKIKEETFIVAIGLRDDFLLVSIGPSTDCLASLGSGPLLVDRVEMKPLPNTPTGEFARSATPALHSTSLPAGRKASVN